MDEWLHKKKEEDRIRNTIIRVDAIVILGNLGMYGEDL